MDRLEKLDIFFKKGIANKRDKETDNSSTDSFIGSAEDKTKKIFHLKEWEALPQAIFGLNDEHIASCKKDVKAEIRLFQKLGRLWWVWFEAESQQKTEVILDCSGLSYYNAVVGIAFERWIKYTGVEKVILKGAYSLEDLKNLLVAMSLDFHIQEWNVTGIEIKEKTEEIEFIRAEVEVYITKLCERNRRIKALIEDKLELFPSELVEELASTSNEDEGWTVISMSREEQRARLYRSILRIEEKMGFTQNVQRFEIKLFNRVWDCTRMKALRDNLDGFLSRKSGMESTTHTGLSAAQAQELLGLEAVLLSTLPSEERRKAINQQFRKLYKEHNGEGITEQNEEEKATAELLKEAKDTLLTTEATAHTNINSLTTHLKGLRQGFATRLQRLHHYCTQINDPVADIKEWYENAKKIGSYREEGDYPRVRGYWQKEGLQSYIESSLFWMEHQVIYVVCGILFATYKIGENNTLIEKANARVAQAEVQIKEEKKRAKKEKKQAKKERAQAEEERKHTDQIKIEIDRDKAAKERSDAKTSLLNYIFQGKKEAIEQTESIYPGIVAEYYNETNTDYLKNSLKGGLTLLELDHLLSKEEKSEYLQEIHLKAKKVEENLVDPQTVESMPRISPSILQTDPSFTPAHESSSSKKTSSTSTNHRSEESKTTSKTSLFNDHVPECKML